MIISLTGFMGVGKSTISEQLSRHLYCKSVDLDRYIEEKEGLTIDDIFRTSGENHFRAKEEFYLNQILKSNTEKVLVLSLGGGTLISKTNQELVKEKTFCIYLKANPETMVKRLMKSRKSRPGIASLSSSDFEKAIERLFEARKEGYEACGSLVIEVDGRPVKDMIAEIIGSI